MGFLSAMGDVAYDVAADVHDAAATPWGGDTWAQQDAAESAHAAAGRAHADRQRVEADRRSVHFTGGFDPAAITQHENWQSYSHQDLYRTNQDSLSQQQASQVARAWKSIAEELRKVGPNLKSDVENALAGGGWEGEAADAAKQAGEPLAQWADNHADALQLTGDQIEQAATAAGQCKGSVPPPQESSVGRSVAASVLSGPSAPNISAAAADGTRQMQEQQEAERQAQQTMARVMTPGYHQADTSTPSFQHVDGQHAPPAPVAEPPAPALPPSPGHHGAAGGAASGGRAGSHHGVGGSGGGGHAVPGGAPAGTSSASFDGHPGPGQPGGPPPGGGQGGAVDGMLPIPPGAGMAGAGAGGAAAAGGARAGFGKGAGGSSAGGGAGKGAGGAAEGRGSTSGGGRSGSGGAEEGAAGAGKAAASGKAAGGGAGAGGMAPGGRGDDETEHDRPTWLEEHDDVWLNDMPRTAPPVFGA